MEFLSTKTFVAIGVSVCFLGLLQYVRHFIQGYWFDRSANLSIANLQGKNVLITGGNAGIGLGLRVNMQVITNKF